MSAGGSADGAVSSINNNHLLILGIIGGLVGIYLCNINDVIGQLLQVSVQYVLLYGELMLYVV